MQEHRAITRLSLASLALAVALGVSLQSATAGPAPAAGSPASLLPENVGVGVLTTDSVSVTFAEPMDAASVLANLNISPASDARGRWSADRRTLTLMPAPRWQTDARYVVTVGAAASRDDGSLLGQARAVSFTTQTAPTVANFQVRLLSHTATTRTSPDSVVGTTPYSTGEFVRLGNQPLVDAPEDTLSDAASETGIRITFAGVMDRADVESRFTIVPGVKGSFSWQRNDLIFTPRDVLKPDTRYAVSLVGAHDLQGNRLAGDVSFSFTTRVGAELVRFNPDRHAEDVLAKQVSIRFSQPMNQRLTGGALSVVDLDNGHRIRGSVRWADGGTLLQYRFREALPRGHRIEVSLGKASHDLSGNRVTIRWTFDTKPAATSLSLAAPRPATPVTGPSAPADLQEFALWQINQARARYGFAPLRLDAAVSGVASAHAWDQINYGYFSHTGRDGSRISDRLRRAGISFSWSGENMCYYNGLGIRAMLEWCHATFMSEPYPGVANHIGNILSSHYDRLGVGIAQSGGKVIIVWDFAG
jgi:uncharacterized protein YkwD